MESDEQTKQIKVTEETGMIDDERRALAVDVEPQNRTNDYA